MVDTLTAFIQEYLQHSKTGNSQATVIKHKLYLKNQVCLKKFID